MRENRFLGYALNLKGYEGVSFALPGMGTQSHLPVIRLNELQTIGYQISGYNFKALSCEAAHLSPQFPCLSIENFLLLTYRLNK